MSRKPSLDETFWDESAHFEEDQPDFSSKECPICMEPLDVTDLSFRPCKCGYQMCRFCWHHIKENMNGKCPACRQPYNPENYTFTPPDPEEILRIQSERKQKERQKKHTDAHQRRALSDIRVIQRNLVYVTNISVDLAKEEILKRYEYFGQYGKVVKLVINKSHVYQGVSVSCYVTYARPEEAFRCIDAVDGAELTGRLLRCSFGTTKYCSHFLRGKTCINPDCMYLHELGDDKDSFTKEDMQAGKHLIRNQQSAAHLKALLASGQAPKPPRKVGVVPKLPPPREDWTVDLEDLTAAATGGGGSWKTQSMGAAPSAHDSAPVGWKTQSQSIPIRGTKPAPADPPRPVWNAPSAHAATSPSGSVASSVSPGNSNANAKAADDSPGPDIVSKSPSKQAAWPTLGAATEKPSKSLRHTAHHTHAQQLVSKEASVASQAQDTIDDGLFPFSAHPVASSLASSQAHPKAVWKTKSQPASGATSSSTSSSSSSASSATASASAAPAASTQPAYAQSSAIAKTANRDEQAVATDKETKSSSPPRDGGASKPVWKVVPVPAPVSIQAELQKSEELKRLETNKANATIGKGKAASSTSSGSALPATASWGSRIGGGKMDGYGDADDELFADSRKRSGKKKERNDGFSSSPQLTAASVVSDSMLDAANHDRDDSSLSLRRSTSSVGSSAPSTPVEFPEGGPAQTMDPLSLAAAVDPFAVGHPDTLDDWLKFTSELLLREQGPGGVAPAPGMFPAQATLPITSPGLSRNKGRSRFQFAQDSDDSSDSLEPSAVSPPTFSLSEDDTRQNALRSLLPGINVKFSALGEHKSAAHSASQSQSQPSGSTTAKVAPASSIPVPQHGLFPSANPTQNSQPPQQGAAWGMVPVGVPLNGNVFINSAPTGLGPSAWGPASNTAARPNGPIWPPSSASTSSPAKAPLPDASAWRGEQPHPDQVLLSMISSLHQQQQQQQPMAQRTSSQGRAPAGWPGSTPGFRPPGSAPPGFRVPQE